MYERNSLFCFISVISKTAVHIYETLSGISGETNTYDLYTRTLYLSVCKKVVCVYLALLGPLARLPIGCNALPLFTVAVFLFSLPVKSLIRCPVCLLQDLPVFPPLGQNFLASVSLSQEQTL
jgi:hypothetical protein